MGQKRTCKTAIKRSGGDEEGKNRVKRGQEEGTLRKSQKCERSIEQREKINRNKHNMAIPKFERFLYPFLLQLKDKTLANYMIEYNVGVSEKKVYEVKILDTDYFEE